MSERDERRREGTVIDRCFDVLELRLSIDEYARVPRNAAYKYEYFGGAAVLSPRPKPRYARIATNAAIATDAAAPLSGGMRLRPLEDEDRGRLVPAFAAAFEHLPPFGALSEERRQEAAREAIADTLDGRDGPLVDVACRVAIDTRNRPLGACLVTRPCDARHVIESMRGQPHLTWIFVAPLAARDGLGTAMLRHALARLRADGWQTLYSTFLVGNEASALWHWERGFELLVNPFSPRRCREGGRG